MCLMILVAAIVVPHTPGFLPHSFQVPSFTASRHIWYLLGDFSADLLLYEGICKLSYLMDLTLVHIK